MSVRVGIIGLGYWGPNVLRNFAMQPGCDMAWGCDLSEKNRAKAARQYPAIRMTERAEDLFEDPTLELVIIATPPASHFPLAKAALEAGKHVFIEKPLTPTTKEADALVKLAKQKRRRIFVDHTFMFAPAVTQMAAFVQRGLLGRLLYFDSTRINLGIIQKDTNVLWDLAIHDLSILSTFIDLRSAVSVSANGKAFFGKQEEVAHLHLSFKNGFQAHIHASWLSPVKLRSSILAGSRAMITYDDTQPSEKLRIYDRGIEHDHTKPDPFFPVYRSGDILIPSLDGGETLSIEAEHVIRCLQGKEEPLASGAAGRAMVAILEAATRAMRTGKTLPLKLR